MTVSEGYRCIGKIFSVRKSSIANNEPEQNQARLFCNTAITEIIMDFYSLQLEFPGVVI